MKPMMFASFVVLALVVAGCGDSYGPGSPPPPPPPPLPAFQLFETLGDSVSVEFKLTQFRAALGGLLNPPNSPPNDSGRREINWDGVPAALTNVDTFPSTFFNVNSKRGAIYIGDGNGLRVDSTKFAAVNAAMAGQFAVFSPKKLFAPVGSNVVNIVFRLVGTTTPALIKGFGAVFTDVDLPGSTTIELFNADDQRIAILTSPNHDDAQLLSFVGAVYEAPLIARVKITSGSAALTPTAIDFTAGGAADLVVMDDFVYGEPRPVPATAQVTVGNNFFQSVHNGTQNSAVDTIDVGARVTWTWGVSGAHSVRSTGTFPAVFQSGPVMNAAGNTYSVRFMNKGTYTYDCGIHGAAMTGRIVVR